MDRNRRYFSACLCCAPLAAFGGAALAQREGVDVGKQSSFTKLISAEQVEQAAAQQYAQLKQEASAKRALAPADHPQAVRLKAIADQLIPFTGEWNARARQWKWEVALLGSPQLNAFCMPGGKIAFYYGILEQLKLTDDEVAMIMGHEMAHALREHAREQIGKQTATRGAIEIGAALLGIGSGGRLLADLGGQLLSLRFGREDESEADLIGLELAARSGYDPAAGISLWRKMGEAAAKRGSPPELLSTHPSGPHRITDIQANLPKVQPLYARAPKPPRRFDVAPPVAKAGASGAAGRETN